MRSAKKSKPMDSHEATRLYMSGQMDVDTYTNIVRENVRRPAEATETLWTKLARRQWLDGFFTGLLVGAVGMLALLAFIAIL